MWIFHYLKKSVPHPMTRSSIHGTHLADHSTRNRSMRLLGVLAWIALCFNGVVRATEPAGIESPGALSFEASSCDKKIMEAIYSNLSGSCEEFKSNFQDEKLTVDSFSRFCAGSLGSKYFKCIESLDLTNLDITHLFPAIFKHMTNLESLDLSGNANLNLNSETFESLCQRLIVLDVSSCNVDESDFSTICSNFLS